MNEPDLVFLTPDNEGLLKERMTKEIFEMKKAELDAKMKEASAPAFLPVKDAVNTEESKDEIQVP